MDTILGEADSKCDRWRSWMIDGGSRGSRAFGLGTLGWRRISHRLIRQRRRQTLFSVLSVAIPLTLLLLVVSVAVGLVAISPQGDQIDYRIEPEGDESIVTPVENPKLGDVHAATDQLNQRGDVAFATPILMEYLVVNGDDRVYLLTFGVIPHPEYPHVAPLSTASLADDGPSGIVLSEPAATAIGVDPGDEIEIHGTETTVRVSAVEQARVPGFAQLPIAVMPLTELQAMTGNDAYDSAHHIGVVAPNAGENIERDLARLYPQTSVQTGGGMFDPRLVDDELPMAMALAAGVTAIMAGTMLLGTSVAFELLAGRRDRMVMEAIGLSFRFRAALLGIELAFIAVVGAILGIASWVLGGSVLNYFARQRHGVALVNVEVELVLVGLGVAVAIAAVTFPLVLLVGRYGVSLHDR